MAKKVDQLSGSVNSDPHLSSHLRGKVRSLLSKFSGPLECDKSVQVVRDGLVASEVKRFEMNYPSDPSEKCFISCDNHALLISKDTPGDQDDRASDFEQYCSLPCNMLVTSSSETDFKSLPSELLGTSSLQYLKISDEDLLQPSSLEDTESRSDISGSDYESDSSGISRTRFVRSFKKRTRTRDYPSRHIKRLHGLADNQVGCRNNRYKEVPNSLNVKSPTYSEVSSGDNRFDSDTYDLCSPGSDDVFWTSDKILKITQNMQTDSYDINSPQHQSSDINDKNVMIPSSQVIEEICKEQYNENSIDNPIDAKVDDWTRNKAQNNGVSILSRISKKVIQKSGVSGKPPEKTVSAFYENRDNVGVNLIFKDKHGKIVEQFEEKYGEQSLLSTPDGKSIETNNKSHESSLDYCMKITDRPQELMPNNEILNNDGTYHLLASEEESADKTKKRRPSPPPRSMKPQSRSRLEKKSKDAYDQETNSSNESLNPSSEIQEGDQAETGKIRAVSSTLCNLWPQFFSTSQSNNKQLDKENKMYKNGFNSDSNITSSVCTQQFESSEECKKYHKENSMPDIVKTCQIATNSQEKHMLPTNSTSQKPEVPDQKKKPGRRILPPNPQQPTRSSSYAPAPAKSSAPSKTKPATPVRSSSFKPVTSRCSRSPPKTFDPISSPPLQQTHLPGYVPKKIPPPLTTANSMGNLRIGVGERLKENVPTSKRAKLFSNFPFYSEIGLKKSESEKQLIKDKKQLKDKKYIADRKGIDEKAYPNQIKMKRSGAVKKSTDEHKSHTNLRRLTSNDPVENKQTDVCHNSNNDGYVHTGAIPKNSYLNKTFHIIHKDYKDEIKKSTAENKMQDMNSKGNFAENYELANERNATEKNTKQSGKKVLDRSISVPFWSKLSLSAANNMCNEDYENVDNKIKSNGANEISASKHSKEDHGKCKTSQGPSVPSSPRDFLRKASHKRTRSDDITKTFKEDFLSVKPERSSSHDDLTNLKENDPKEVPVLAIDFASPDSPPQLEYKSLRFADNLENYSSAKPPLKHKSCNNIIDVNGDVLQPMSPKFARAFKDSKLRSSSALCLTNSQSKKTNVAVRRELADYSPSTESLPPMPFEVDNAPQQVYISPYELSAYVKDKPYFQKLIGLLHIQASDSKMDALVQQLDLYSRQGIPKQPHLLTCQTYELDQEVIVEDSWRTLVENHEQLDDRQEQQQSAIWELVETEATYIHMLKVITDLFLSCLCNLQNETLLCEIDTDKLFSNIQEIYTANLTFWKDHICRMLDVARSSRLPLDPTLLSDGFYKFDELFHPYTKYCLDQSQCQLYCKEKDHDNEYFKMYLAWCETQKECNRLRLVDIIVQPMQRLTKYSLLLKAILKKTSPEDHKLELLDMITHVENFVSNVNSALRHKHEQERLRDIAKRIEAYEAVDARDDELEKVVKNYSDLNLTQPMPGCPEHLPRHILQHGDLRLRDTHTSKMDVHVFLFTDLLLITKVTQRKAEKVKIIRPPYHVERLILVDLKDTTSIGLVSINEWNVAVAAFTLQCPDQRTHRIWHDALKRAKDQYKEAQQARDVMIYDDMACVGHLAPRSPRPGSSRASRVSSLAHSHSGSIDLNEHSPASTHHPPSLDMGEIRASSASSDDSIAPVETEIQRSKSLEGGGCCSSSSPRADRRPTFSKSPNTLSVVPPYSTGQSLPNLAVENPNVLRVPGIEPSNNPKALSAVHRGISYPPPSPRTLRRSAPVPQSRNPPLIKTRHVTSMVGSPQDAEQQDQDENNKVGAPRRVSRTDRMDNRRYHTAGAIDDIKKQDTKDATIHKRLSWNYGQGPPPSRDLGNDQGKLGRHKHAIKSVSCESMHSSSGVSSTSSLHRSMGSEIEQLENIDDNEIEDGENTVVDLTVSDCTSLKISPHISTTYICHDSDITLGVCSQYITQPNNTSEPSEGCENLVKIDVNETDPGISSVQITVTEGATSSSSLNVSPASEGASTKPDVRMREILLNDSSVEASDV